MKTHVIVVFSVAVLGMVLDAQLPAAKASDHPAPLVQLTRDFRAWRWAERDKIADYAAQAQAEKTQLADYRRRLDAIDANSWSIHNKVDYLVVRSEMDEMDFDLRVIRQASRNPDFYTTEAVERVARLVGGRYQMGPGVTVPYDAKRAESIVHALGDTDTIVRQAKNNLTEAVGPMADMALDRLADINCTSASVRLDHVRW
jgi:hypothetical protein